MCHNEKHMKKGLLALAFSIVFFTASLASTAMVSAAALEVTSIGGISTGGSLTTWTHEGFNPLLVGTASASASISIDIDSVVESTMSAADGSWSFKPTTLSSAGSYEVAISSGSQSVLFTLAIAEAQSSTASTTSTTSGSVAVPDELPQTGTDDILLLLAGGVFLVITGAYAGAHLLGYFSEA